MRIKPRILTSVGVPAILVAAFAFSVWVVHSILSAAPELRIQYVPDDAFYYLTLARNFAVQGRWTFDSGTSVTTGFHPLYAYVLALAYQVAHPAPEQFLRLSILISYLPVIPVFLLAAALARRANNIVPALVLFLFMLSRNVSLNSVSGVEWSFVVLMSSLYCVVFGWRTEFHGRGAGWLLFGCGLLGSLARSDFGLLPAALVLAAWIACLLARERGHLGRAFAGLGGAVLGLALILAHSYAVGGDLQQSSARMKLLWLDTYGPSAEPISRMLLGILGTRSNFNVCAMITALACIALALGLRALLVESPSGDSISRPVVAGGGAIPRTGSFGSGASSPFRAMCSSTG